MDIVNSTQDPLKTENSHRNAFFQKKKKRKEKKRNVDIYRRRVSKRILSLQVDFWLGKHKWFNTKDGHKDFL